MTYIWVFRVIGWGWGLWGWGEWVGCGVWAGMCVGVWWVCVGWGLWVECVGVCMCMCVEFNCLINWYVKKLSFLFDRGPNEKNRRIVFGDTEANGASPYRQEVAIHREYVHPNFSDPNVSFLANRLRLLQLEEPVNITDYVRPICMSQSDNESEDYDVCWLASWGHSGPTGN